MFIKRLFFIFIFSFFAVIFLPSDVFAGSCGCQLQFAGTVENPRFPQSIKECTADNPSYVNDNSCDVLRKTGTKIGTNYTYLSCEYFETKAVCEENFVKATKDDENKEVKTDTSGQPAGYVGFLPACAFNRDIDSLNPEDNRCRNINDLLYTGIRIGEFIFSIIGSVAFVMFVYGGITVVTSFGNAEKVKKGYGILTAALIGLVIAFSAYILVEYILDTLNVQSEFNKL